MLRKKERLTTEQFNHFFSVGKRTHSKHLQLIYSPHTQFHGAAVVGKKVFKSAVKRNKLRRRIYNILYNIKSSQDLDGVYMLIAKPSAKDAAFSELKDEVSDIITLNP